MPKTQDEILDDLRRKELHIDCVRMELVRASDGKNYSGTGYIRQKSTRGFEIKMYAKGKLNFNEIFSNWESTKPGVIFKEADHFVLIAHDEFHRAWRADRIVNPDPDGHVEREGYIVTANCDEISLTQSRFSEEKINWMKLRSFDTIKFPCNTRTEETTIVGKSRSAQSGRLNAAEFDSNGLSFCFEDDDGLSMSASAEEAALPPRLEERITETVTFALGAIPRWAMLMRSEGKETTIRFRNYEVQVKGTTQWPPYKIEIIDGTGSVWRMFDRYLAQVIKDTVSISHTLSRSVFGVSNTRRSSIEGQALAASVAVESILAEFYPTVGKRDPEDIKSIERLITYLETWDGDSRWIKRAVGSVSSLKNTLPGDQLDALVAMGAIGEPEHRRGSRYGIRLPTAGGISMRASFKSYLT